MDYVTTYISEKIEKTIYTPLLNTISILPNDFWNCTIKDIYTPIEESIESPKIRNFNEPIKKI